MVLRQNRPASEAPDNGIVIVTTEEEGRAY